MRPSAYLISKTPKGYLVRTHPVRFFSYRFCGGKANAKRSAITYRDLTMTEDQKRKAKKWKRRM